MDKENVKEYLEEKHRMKYNDADCFFFVIYYVESISIFSRNVNVVFLLQTEKLDLLSRKQTSFYFL